MSGAGNLTVPLMWLSRWIAKGIVHSFFKEVTVLGLERLPVNGPVILVGNHQNQFVDATIVMALIPRSIRFLIASVSMRLRVVGRLARMNGAIAVDRPQDMQYAGMGRIVDVVAYSSWQPNRAFYRRRSSLSRMDHPGGRHNEDFSVIVGDAQTRFPLDCKKGDKIRVKGFGQAVTVAEIIDNHHLIVKEPLYKDVPPPQGSHVISTDTTPETPQRIVKNELEVPDGPPSPPVEAKGKWGFTVLPKVDQGDIYEAVSRALYEGNSICIFPEGGSHDRPGLLPLKPGVAIMALNTALMGVEDVLIVPFGLYYYARHKFGSRAVLEIGQPIPVPQDLVEMYAKDQRREAVDTLMRNVKDAMATCVISAPDFESIKVVELCASLYPPERMHITSERSYQLYQLFNQIFNTFEDDSGAQKLREEILSYNTQLEANGIPDGEVWQLKQTAEHAFLSMLEKVATLICILVVTVPPMLIWGPFKLLMNYMSERHRRAAKAKSSVKIQGLDVVASYKIIWIMILMPICMILCGLLGWAFMAKAADNASNVRGLWGLAACMLLSWTALPPLTYQFLRMQGKIIPLCRQVRCLYRVIIAELDVWRDRERELIFDRIDMQLKVRGFVRHLFNEETIAAALSERAMASKARLASSSMSSFAVSRMNSTTRGQKVLELQSELERLIPFIVLEADTRRLLRAKDRYIPLVYRSALASREEIL